MAAPVGRAPPSGRPAVWLNCAASLDGRLAFAEGARARLSSPEDLERVQRLRADVDGIVVGVGTVLLDDPSLRVHWELLHRPAGSAPYRIVLDGRGRTPEGARVLDGSAPTIVATTERNRRSFPPHVRTIVAGTEEVDLARLFAELHRLGLRRLLVEGGSAVLASVVRAGLFDRWTVYYAPVAIGGTRAPPLLAGPETHGFEDAVRVELAGIERVGEGFVATYLPSRGSPR
ncbi:MAG TPA: dihydrofolate reductase family protein [Thermoplasmata archaeon]|nr:dihydrofolate reductase family protein [Thermoplasmata archaeon]